MLPPSPTSIAMAHNKLIGPLIPARLVTQSRFTPGCLWLTTDGRTPLTTTMRMVTRIHGRASDRRTTPHMTRSPSFADAAVFVIYISHLADCCHAEDVYPALLTRRQTYQSIIALFCHELSTYTRTTGQLTTTTSCQLNVVNCRTGRDIFQGKRIAWLNISLRPCHHSISDF